ncbi:MAG: TonB family protein [Proteobacteria bacterium]|nr:TonB family protein [Pseudomonadota bacterium]
MTFLLKDSVCPANPKKLQTFEVALIPLQINKNIKTTQITGSVKKYIANVDKIKKFEEAESSTNTSDNEIAPSVIYCPHPNYPEHAKANGQEGEFSITLKVNTGGNVERVNIETIRGDLTWFEADLLKIFKTWKFAPCKKNSNFSIPITFLLDE